MVVARFNSPWAVKPVIIPCGIWEGLTGNVVVRTTRSGQCWLIVLAPLWVKLITGEYPRYDEILPPVGESQGYGEYNRKEFIAALKASRQCLTISALTPLLVSVYGWQALMAKWCWTCKAGQVTDGD